MCLRVTGWSRSIVLQEQDASHGDPENTDRERESCRSHVVLSVSPTDYQRSYEPLHFTNKLLYRSSDSSNSVPAPRRHSWGPSGGQRFLQVAGGPGGLGVPSVVQEQSPGRGSVSSSWKDQIGLLNYTCLFTVWWIVVFIKLRFSIYF